MLKEGFDFSRLSQGFSDLTKKLQLDLLRIDTHPGIEEETLLSIATSDILIVILRPDEQDYLGTAITLEIAKRIGVPKTFLVANRVQPELDPESFRGNLEKIYGLPVIGVLPFSYGLMMSQSKTICCHTSANDPFSTATRTVAGKLLENIQQR